MKLLIDTDWATFVEDLSQEKQLEFFWAIFDYGNHDCSLKCWSKIAPLLEKGKIKYYNRLNNLKQFNTERESESVSESEPESVTESEPERESEREYKYKIENIQDSNKGVIGGKEKGDSFVDALEKEELAKVKKTPKPKKEQPKILYTGKHEYLKAQIERWLEYKQSRKEMYKSPQSVLVCVKRLHELCGGDVSVAEKIIDQSIGNNWAGLFALKQQPQKAKSISSPDYVGEGSFLRRAEDDPFCADL